MTSKRRQNSVGEPARRPVIDRLLIARIASGIGALGIVVAVLAVMVQRDISPLLLLGIAVGIGGIALWTVLAPEDLRAMLRGRQLAYGGNSLLSTVFLIGIVVIVYVITANSTVVADFTSVGYYSLKEDVRKAVARIDRPMQITAFYTTARLNDRALDTPVLQMFADARPDILKVVYINPDEQPLIGKQLGLTGATGVYVSYLDDKGQIDPNLTVKIRGDFARESWIAEAMLQLQARGKYLVMFTVGNDEITTDLPDKGDAYGIRAGLESVGVQTGTIDLRSFDIPSNTTALVMLRPQRELAKAEVDRIAKYLDNGGKLLLMAKPAYIGAITFMALPDSPMTTYLWEKWGIRPQRDIVFDPVSNVENPYRTLASWAAAHPIMKRDQAGTSLIRPLLTIAQSWEISSKLPDGVVVAPLIRSSDKSIGKTNLQKVASNPDSADNLKEEPGDLKGPLVMAAAGYNSKGGRIIVVGDADWVYNETIVTFDGQFLWTNMIDWLTQYLATISVQPTVKTLPLIATTQTLNVVLLISMVIVPGIVLLVGGVVWWDRLRRQ